ncbi:MAG: 30S ribosomal protein S5 [Candidatus Liptonbacteria bacterium]|nr:30S ribosomal protein S5 [Candidatus Liptonbacteria bacterium]
MMQESRKRDLGELREATLDMRRVTRVVKGGKRFRFRATIVVGNGRGSVGVGVAKGADVAQAVAKAKERAKKALITIVMSGKTIPHEAEAKYSAARVFLKPAKEGSGIKAGGAPRIVLSLAGIENVTAKCVGRTANKLTNAMATIHALKMLRHEKHTYATE